jgi:hypothetical protein
MTLKWMADRLKMGTWTHVANRLCHLKSKIGVNILNPFAFTKPVRFLRRVSWSPVSYLACANSTTHPKIISLIIEKEFS